MPPAVRPKVALVNSILYRRDAVSNIAYAKLCAYSGAHADCEIQAFVYDTDYTDPNIHRVGSIAELLNHPYFRSADVVVWEFGMFYALFDALLISDAANIVYFHNVTPSALFDDPAKSELNRRGEQQIDNIAFADLVLCNSRFSMEDLERRELGGPEIAVLAPPVKPVMPAFGALTREADPAAIRLAFLGRIVPQKGLLDLLEALAEARRLTAKPLHLSIAGSTRYSDPAYAALIQQSVLDHGLQSSVSFLGELDDPQLWAFFAGSHALVMPSKHEGFCVPVIEAMATGAYVIAYDGSNLRYVADGLGALVPQDDVHGLARVIAAFGDSFRDGWTARRYQTAHGALPVSDFEARAKAYAAGFSMERFQAEFRRQVAAMLARKGRRDPTPQERPVSRRLPAIEQALARWSGLVAAVENMRKHPELGESGIFNGQP